MSEFKFKLGAIVRMTHSKESGEVIGRAEYTTSENNYFVRYRAGDGRQVEVWWSESALRYVGQMPSEAAAEQTAVEQTAAGETSYIGEAEFVGEPLRLRRPIVIIDTLGDLNDILARSSPLPTA